MWRDLDSREVVLADLILQECAVIFSTDCHTNWHEMVEHKSILAEKQDMHDFQSTLTVPCNFLTW